jgi:hypothetical protein
VHVAVKLTNDLITFHFSRGNCHADAGYCTIMNCSSPVSDCDKPDEIFASSPCQKACDIGKFSSSSGGFVAIFTDLGDVFKAAGRRGSQNMRF